MEDRLQTSLKRYTTEDKMAAGAFGALPLGYAIFHFHSLPFFPFFPEISPIEESATKFTNHFLYAGRMHTGISYDIIVLIDSSSSVGKLYFKKAVQALQELITKAHWESHFAVVTVATRCEIVVNFTSGKVAAEKLGKLSRSGGKTNTQAALELSRKMYEEPQFGARFGSFKRILLLTDGNSNIQPEKTFTNAIDLRLMGVEIFVIAYGDSYLDGIEEMTYIASSSDAHLYRLGDIRGLVRIVKLIPQDRRAWFGHVSNKPSIDGL